MLRYRTTAAIAAALVGSTLLVITSGPAQAHPTPPPPSFDPASFEVTPDQGPVGTRITLSGEDCVDEDGPGFVSTTMVRFDGGRSQWFNITTVYTAPTANADGTWSIATTVPDRLEDTYVGSVESVPGTYRLAAFCFVGERSEIDGPYWTYDEIEFEVTPSPEQPATTTPTTIPGSPTTPPPAKPVTGEPPFTG